MGRRTVIGGSAVLAGTAAVLGGRSVAAASGGQRRADDEAAIRQLTVNYALGTDAVAVGDTSRAAELYAITFTPDAPISAGFDRSAPALEEIGPVDWAARVKAAFVDYAATQHLLGTIDVRFDDGDRDLARMTSYLNATHVYRARPELLTVLGTYVDTVRRVRHVGWRITERFLQFTAYEVSPRIAPPTS